MNSQNMMNEKRKPFFSPLLSYLVGMVVGVFLVFVATWADMESAFYGFPRLADAGLRGFTCPVLMTRSDAATISLKLSNPTDGKVSPTVKTMISTPLVSEEFIETIELAPGESKRLEWRVDSDNVDLDRFIFAKVLMYSAYPLPSRETSCGIFILDLPVSGRVMLPLFVAISLLGMGWGLYGMNRFNAGNAWIEKNLRAMAFVAIMLALGLVISFIGGWIPSILVLAVVVLMLIYLLGSFLLSGRRER
jgi:hypothetical protein